MTATPSSWHADIAALAPPAQRSSDGENFPVASRLWPARMRRAVMDFYAFVRAADDIADHPDWPAETKQARLDEMEALLATAPFPAADEARAMLTAFRWDADGFQAETETDLLRSCRYSAEPVGRFLVRLFDAGDACLAPAEALSSALQVLNHVQDAGVDWRRRGRLYIPRAWLGDAGLTADALAEDQTDPALRAVLDRMLDLARAKLDATRALPGRSASRLLGAQAGAVLACARALDGRLRRRDPLAGRVALGRAHLAGLAGLGALRGLAWSR